MVGIGCRTNMKSAAYLMENDLLGTDRFALVVDETDLDQQRMHLDTIFNIVSQNKAIVLAFEELSKIKGRPIGRKVFVYSKSHKGEALPPIDNSNKLTRMRSNEEELDFDKKENFKNVYESTYGDYKLAIVYEDFYTFLQDEKYTLIKVTNKQQEDYMINFLNIGNNSIISVNKDLKNVIKKHEIDGEDINVIDLDFDAVVKMYGAVHCATQVSRRKAA